MGARHEYLKALFDGDTAMHKFIDYVTDSTYINSKMVKDIVLFLRDDNIKLKAIGKSGVKSLVRLLYSYNKYFGTYAIWNEGYSRLAKAAKTEVYYTDAINGVRISTSGEIKNGVRGLMIKEEYPIGEEKYRLINLFVWTITGNLRNYREAGYRYTFKDGEIKDDIYDLIKTASQGLVDLLKMGENKDSFRKELDKLEAISKRGKYKYPGYAADEIVEETSIKKIMFNLDKRIPRGSSRADYRRALAIIIKCKENKRLRLAPIDMAFLREVWEEVRKEETDVGTDKQKGIDNSVNAVLKEQCNTVEKAVVDGIVPKDHFSLKIIETLKGRGYNKCSDKMYTFIEDALNIIEDYEKQKDIVINDADMIESDKGGGGYDIIDISNALGDGLLK